MSRKTFSGKTISVRRYQLGDICESHEVFPEMICSIYRMQVAIYRICTPLVCIQYMYVCMHTYVRMYIHA